MCYSHSSVRMVFHLEKPQAADFHTLLASFNLKRVSTHKSGNLLDLIYTCHCSTDHILAFKDIINSIGVRQHVSGPTRCRIHTLDLILSHGIDVDAVEILQQSDNISDHYLASCKLNLAKAAKPTVL